MHRNTHGPNSNQNNFIQNPLSDYRRPLDLSFCFLDLYRNQLKRRNRSAPILSDVATTSYQLKPTPYLTQAKSIKRESITAKLASSTTFNHRHMAPAILISQKSDSRRTEEGEGCRVTSDPIRGRIISIKRYTHSTVVIARN